MHDPRAVSGVQRLSYLPADGKRLIDGHRSVGDPLVQGRSLDQLEDQRLDALGLLQPEDAADPGVVERREARTLTATSRPSLVSVARYTSPMPPSPSLAVISKWVNVWPIMQIPVRGAGAF
jgi:hypothetical protein